MSFKWCWIKKHEHSVNQLNTDIPSLTIFTLLKTTLHKLVLWTRSTILKYFLVRIKGEVPSVIGFPCFYPSKIPRNFIFFLREKFLKWLVQRCSIYLLQEILFPLMWTSTGTTSSLEQSYMNLKLKYFKATFITVVSWHFNLEKRIIVLPNILCPKYSHKRSWGVTFPAGICLFCVML